jgi:two-component system sensor histidine kinase/response regulator
VDDNEAAALILSELLGGLGFEVQHVNSGQAAIDKLVAADANRQPYEFVMMDWLMPGMDGLETVQVIRDLHINSSPFVLMVTAHRRQELIKGAEHLGISHVLAKPVSPSLVIDTMMRVMGETHEAPAAPSAAFAVSGLEAQLGGIAHARILLVEDNEINQLVACEMLRGAGLAVDVAENGQLAVHSVAAAAAQQQPYDLVLMDMQMPVMDGVTASRLLRETYSAAELPIVAMTANAMKADRDRCLEAGMNGFVTKPIHPDELWRALLRWVPERQWSEPRPQRPAATGLPTGDDAHETQDALIQTLRQVPELDVACGLQNTNGKPRFYVSLLKKFVSAHAQAPQEISQYLAAGDRRSAERVAHTIRGTAGTLGATALQASAQALERGLHGDGSDESNAHLLADMATRVAQLVGALQEVPALFQEDVTDTPQAGPMPNDENLIHALRMLLADNDASAVDLWESQATALHARFANAAQIEAAVSSYDFENALALLEANG